MVLDGHGAALCSGCPGCILPSWQCRSSRCSWRGSVYLLRVVLTQSVAVKALFASSQVTAAKPVNHPSSAIKFSPVCGIRAALSQSEQAESQNCCPRPEDSFYFDPTAASAAGTQFLKVRFWQS